MKKQDKENSTRKVCTRKFAFLLLLHTIKRSSTFPVATDVGVVTDEEELLPFCVIFCFRLNKSSVINFALNHSEQAVVLKSFDESSCTMLLSLCFYRERVIFPLGQLLDIVPSSPDECLCTMKMEVTNVKLIGTSRHIALSKERKRERQNCCLRLADNHDEV